MCVASQDAVQPAMPQGSIFYMNAAKAVEGDPVERP